MNSPWIRNALFVFVLAGAVLAVGCGPEGKYRDSDGSATLELKDGKANLNLGGIHIDGTYKADGDKLTIRPVVGDTNQTMVFTINKDDSLEAPQGSGIPRLEKAK